jgi:hypothetical protein
MPLGLCAILLTTTDISRREWYGRHFNNSNYWAIITKVWLELTCETCLANTLYMTVYGMFSGPIDPSTAVFDGHSCQKHSQRARRNRWATCRMEPVEPAWRERCTALHACFPEIINIYSEWHKRGGHTFILQTKTFICPITQIFIFTNRKILPTVKSPIAEVISAFRYTEIKHSQCTSVSGIELNHNIQ